MMEGNDDPALNEQPVFAAELTPHRSLGRRGFRVMLLIAGLLTIVHMVFFLIAGAWPVVVFFGIDFLLLIGAFRLNYRAALAREEVSVSRTALSIRKYAPSGTVREVNFNPFWARLNIVRHDEIGIVSMQVSDGRRQTDIGSFLNREDRESFATAFSGALATVRRR